jgi:hypothetical protein
MCSLPESQTTNRQPGGVIVTAITDGWDCTDLRRKPLYDYVGLILQEVEPGEFPKWKDIGDCSPICKSYWARGDSLVVRDSVPKFSCESAKGVSKRVQTVPFWSKVKKQRA